MYRIPAEQLENMGLNHQRIVVISGSALTDMLVIVGQASPLTTSMMAATIATMMAT